MMLVSGMNLITTVIGFGMSATFIVFICTRLICGRNRTIESRQMFEMESRIDLEQPGGRRITGLEPVVLAAIPSMKFNKEAFNSVEDAQCPICLCEYQEKEMLRIMPECRHNFHLTCIDVWLQKQPTCPVCRLPLQDSFEIKPVRPSIISMVLQSMNETEIDYSHQWLLPDHERSVGNGNGNGEGLHETIIPTNMEGIHTGEAEIRI